MTFVKARLKLDDMEKGDELEILLCEGEPLDNVPKTIEECGCRVISLDRAGQFHRLKVRK